MKFTLRAYQQETIDLLRQSFRGGSKRPILCLPTGAGKTVTFSQIAEAATSKGNRVLVVCHRKELIDQARVTMRAYGVDLLRVSFQMVQTLVRNPHKIPSCSVCIIDECHTGNFRKFVEMLPPSVMCIGATATPISATKKHPLRKTFTSVISPVQISDLIEQGYLSKPTHHLAKFDDSQLQVGSDGEYTTASQDEAYMGLFGNINEAYLQRQGKTIIFCSSIKISIEVAAMLGALCVHSKMSENERDQVVSAFKSSYDGCIVNCGILTAGFDDPLIRTVIVFRATTSLSLWLQMCGRGSRIIPDEKDSFHIIDMGNNIRRHGLWHLERDWKYIFENEGKRKSTGEAPYKNCINPECQCLILASARICAYCGLAQPVKPKEQILATGFDTLEYGEQAVPSHLRKPWSEMSVSELIERAKIGNLQSRQPYKFGWIMGQIKQRSNDEARQMIAELANLKGYSKGWIFHQTKNL
jgi:superfamily II DNA or RNA helicase